MLARIVGIVLGGILATSGYVVAGWGQLGSWAANLDLGPFEPHRPFAGGAAAILGGVLIVAALAPSRDARPRPRKTLVLPVGDEPVLAGTALTAPEAQPSASPADQRSGVAEPEPALLNLAATEPRPAESLLVVETPPVAEPAGHQTPVVLGAKAAPTGPSPSVTVSEPEPAIATPELHPAAALFDASPAEASPPVAAPDEPPLHPTATLPDAVPVAPALVAAAEPETFGQLRERMVTQSRSGDWPETARLLIAMKSSARGHVEKATAYRDLGDFARSQGQMDDAAEAYETAVSHARDAFRAAPHDDAVLELLAGSLSGIGDVAEMEGRLDAALAAFEEALALRRSRGGREAHDPAAQRALSVSLERLADIREDRGHRMRALDLYRESYDVAARLAAADPARFGEDLAQTRQRLAELEARVGV